MKKLGILVCVLLFLLSFGSCTQEESETGGKAPDPELALDIAAYASYLGLSKADALDALGIKEEDLVAVSESGNTGKYLWEGKTVQFGDLEFPVYLRFSGAIGDSGEEGDMYLNSFSLKLPIDADTMDYTTMWECFTAMQDTLMRQCGRPRTYLDTDFTTDIHWDGQVNPQTEFGYMDYWLVSEDAFFPGMQEECGGAVSTAKLELVNNLREGRENARYISLWIGLRGWDQVSGPRISGEDPSYIFL